MSRAGSLGGASEYLQTQRWRPTAHSIRRAAATRCCVSAWADLLNGFFIGDMYSWFFSKNGSKLVSHDTNLLHSACTTKQSLPKERCPNWDISSYKAGPFDRSTIRHKGCLLFRCDLAIELRPIVTTPNPEHKWFAAEHDTPPPVFRNDGLRFVPQLLKLDTNPFRQRAPVAERIGFLVFSRIDLKEIATK